MGFLQLQHHMSERDSVCWLTCLPVTTQLNVCHENTTPVGVPAFASWLIFEAYFVKHTCCSSNMQFDWLSPTSRNQTHCFDRNIVHFVSHKIMEANVNVNCVFIKQEVLLGNIWIMQFFFFNHLQVIAHSFYDHFHPNQQDRSGCWYNMLMADAHGIFLKTVYLLLLVIKLSTEGDRLRFSWFSFICQFFHIIIFIISLYLQQVSCCSWVYHH